MNLPAEPSDEELMIRTREGDRSAYDQLMLRHRERLVGYLQRLSGQVEVALDLAQEAFLRIYLHRHNYEPRARFQTFLFHVATNLLRNRFRARQREVAFVDPVHLHQVPGRERADPAEQADLQARFREAVDELPAHYREVVILRLEEELPFQEIARILEIRPGTARERMRVAREKLQVRLEGFLEE